MGSSLTVRRSVGLCLQLAAMRTRPRRVNLSARGNVRQIDCESVRDVFQGG